MHGESCPILPSTGLIPQALRPAVTFDFSPTRHWNIQASASYESTRGFHVYDILETGFAGVIYFYRSIGTFNDRTGNEGTEKVHLKYPIRFSGGMQEETFPNFTPGAETPV